MANQDLTIEGTVIEILPTRCGTSQNGIEWTMKDYVILKEDNGRPSKLLITVSGADRIERMALAVGQKRRFCISVESRCFTTKEGRNIWNTDVRCFDAREITA